MVGGPERKLGGWKACGIIVAREKSMMDAWDRCKALWHWKRRRDMRILPRVDEIRLDERPSCIGMGPSVGLGVEVGLMICVNKERRIRRWGNRVRCKVCMRVRGGWMHAGVVGRVVSLGDMHLGDILCMNCVGQRPRIWAT